MAEDFGPAAGRIRLKITCPTHLVADLEVDSVRLPGVLGNRLVLPHQAPYFMRLTAGPAILHRAGQNDVVYLLSAGVCEVRRDICAVMAWAIRPEDVDPAVIQDRLKMARTVIQKVILPMARQEIADRIAFYEMILKGR